MKPRNHITVESNGEAEALAEFTAEWKQAKDRERAAEADRLIAESEIVDALGHRLPPQGTVWVNSLRIITGFTDKWDQERLASIAAKWSGEIGFPFVRVWQADGKAVDFIRARFPKLYQKLNPALERTARKPYFSEENNHA
jgi:hypothetical protein